MVFVGGGVWVSEREREREIGVDTNKGCNNRQLAQVAATIPGH